MLRLTGHATQRLRERGIALAWVEAAVGSPDWISADADPALTRSFKVIDEFGGRVLRVVHRADGPDIVVITALFDRSAA